MNKKVLLIFSLLMILYFFLAHQWYVRVKCNDSIKKHTSIVKKENLPLYFNWNKDKPETSQGWVLERASLISRVKNGETLTISGPYFASEKNTTSFKNIGIARAYNIRSLLHPDIDTSQIKLSSELIDESKKDSYKNAPFAGYTYSWKAPIPSGNKSIEQYDGKTFIYFPSNSTQAKLNDTIVTYLKSLIDDLKDSGKKIEITGFTDNVGDSSYNQSLGLKRANVVKAEFVVNGYPSENIETMSLGEENPIASNETEEGRKQNRRVELKIKQ